MDEFLILSHQNNNLGSFKRVFKSPKPSGASKAPRYDFLEKTCEMAYFCLILAVFALPEPPQCLREGYISTHAQLWLQKMLYVFFEHVRAFEDSLNS